VKGLRGILGRSRLRRALGVARRSALRAGYYSGALWAARRLTRAKKSGLLVLMYHSVGRPAELDPYLSVSEKNFAGQLEYLLRYYEVMPLERAVELIERGESLPENAAAITFDDGYRDNYDKALPLLERHGCTATFFVSTAPLSDRQPLWPNELFLWFAETRAARLVLPGASLNGERLSFELGSRRRRKAAHRAVEALLLRVGNAERERLIGEIAERLGVSRAAERPAMLTWAQVKKIAAAGMTIGSHTATHPVLSMLTADDAMKELTGSKASLERELSRSVTLFAYPFGSPADFNRETQALVLKAGYTAACSTIIGVNDAGADRLALRRVGAHDDPPGLFAFRLSRLRH
jgi:peptidoglycan/xylan/chitin deacetylase (PgdA/CDA1 family)